MKPQGRLTLTIRDAEGSIVAERHAQNRVLRGGAQLIAGLFAGKVTTGGINRVRFGFGTDPLPPDAIDVRPRFVIPEPPLLPFMVLNPEMALTWNDHFTIDDGPESVIVHVRAPLTPADSVEKVSEAGLFAGNVLYNHVLFEPVDMTVGQTITFFWEIEFPFGR